MKKTAKALAALACMLALAPACRQACAEAEVRAPARPHHVSPGAAPLPERRLQEEHAEAPAAGSAEVEARRRAASAERRAMQDAFREDLRRRIEEASRLAPGVQPDGSVVVRGPDGSVRITKRSAGPAAPQASEGHAGEKGKKY